MRKQAKTTTKAATTTTTLKAFVRVSKNSEAPSAKAVVAAVGTTRLRPLTRSRSSKGEDVVVVAAAAAAAKPAEEIELVAKKSRKRKLAATDDEDSMATTLPAQKKQTKEALPPPPKSQTTISVAATASCTPRRKKATTISAYFSPSAKKDAPEVSQEIPSVIETAPVVETIHEVAPAVEVAPIVEVALPAVELPLPPSRAQLKGRAAELLTRLRSRHKPAVTSAAETRSIQDDLRARRTPSAAAAAIESTSAHPTEAAAAASAKFAESGTLSQETVEARAMHRQFVSIGTTGNAPPLPQHLRKLHELFQALDHVVLFGGQRSVIYHRARAGVEAMAKRTFGWRELGQILALLPDAYVCTAVPAVHNGRRVVSVELTPRTGGGLDLAVEIDARRRQFAHALGARVDAAHRAFLADRGYADADVDALRGAWHPAFDVESTPHVTPLPLPPAPAAAAGPVAAFDRARLCHLLNEKEKEEEEEKEKPPAVLALPPTPASSPALAPADAAPKKKPRPPPGTAKNLLERIREKQRAREAAQLAEAAGANAVPLATRTMHSRLPGILETLSFLFYTERHSVLPYFYVVDKLAESKCLERADASAHIIALAGFVPEWCSISDHSETLPSSPDHSEAPDGAAKIPKATVGPLAEPSPEARLTITRTISMQEAKARLIAKL